MEQENNEKDFNELDDSALLQCYSDNLVEYSDWIDKKIPLDLGMLEEAEYMSFLRSDINLVIEELKKRGLKPDGQKLHELDRKWRMWIARNTSGDFRLEHRRDNIPKNQWWEWLDDPEVINDTTE